MANFIKRFFAKAGGIKFSAFTLAEVLITLGIIGVVAAMTIPSLLNKSNDQEMVARLKKVYSTLENARKLVEIDEGGDISSVFPDNSQRAIVATRAFTNHMKVLKNCGTQTGCLYHKPVWGLQGTIQSSDFESLYAVDAGKFILADGTIVVILPLTGNSCNEYNQCSYVIVDLNGSKLPNMYGQDIFEFMIGKDAVRPYGAGYPDDSINNECSKYGLGAFCAMKVLREGAINYEHGIPE